MSMQFWTGLIQGLSASNTTTGQAFTFPQGQIAGYGFGATQPAEREHKIEVPIVEKGDRGGLFLKGEHGELIHVSSERLYKAFCDW